MNRRDFTKKSVIGTSAVIAGLTTPTCVFAEIVTKQNFDFMAKEHQNTLLIHDFFSAYANNDLEAIKNVLAEDIKWHIPGEHPLSGTKKGINQVLEFFKALNKGAFKAEPIIMGVNDNYVIDCHKNWSNVDGIENLNAMSCLLWRIEDKKIKEVHNFPENQKVVDVFFNKLYS